jgi:uncharacterized protein
MKGLAALLILSLIPLPQGAALARDYEIAFVPADRVEVNDAFWNPWLERNRGASLPHLFRMCEEAGLFDNFAVAAGLKRGAFSGLKMGDEVVYKTVETASLMLARRRDALLEKRLDEIIALIAAAQEADGYLYTQRTIDLKRGQNPQAAPRWSNMRDNELYYGGHLYEAAVAHFEATGKRTLLDVAIKHANLVDSIFGADKRRDVCGHPNVEQALVKLWRATNDGRYLKLARFFVDERGRANGRQLLGAFAQDHKPLVEQDEVVGQAPRATYLYSAATDLAALTGDGAYARALERLWRDAVTKKMYVTGGVGSRHDNEGFGEPYELPNLTAYTEACAAVSFSMWNARMFQLFGDAKYVDVMERTLYNNFLSGVSLNGEEFCYACPTESDAKFEFNLGWVPKGYAGPYTDAAATRKGWFACACCPPNVTRWMEQIPGFVYATDGRGVYVNLFVGGEARVLFDGRAVTLKQETGYPWDGRTRITLKLGGPARFDLHVRVPGWARGEAVPGDLYRFADESGQAPRLKVNGQAEAIRLEKGFARVTREWRAGDTIELELPMNVRRVVSRPEVAENRGKVALERGPVVYCAEGVDNGGSVLDLTLPRRAALKAEHQPRLLGGVTALAGTAERGGRAVEFKAIPYFAWANRGVTEMAVWLKSR